MAEENTNTDNQLLTQLKEHIRWEDGMDESMLSFYLKSAEKYVTKKIGYTEEYLVIMVATLMNDNRSSSEDLTKALSALEPIFSLEVLTNGTSQTEPTN
ncbi:phage head-tail connector protein [Liquorilactobacillus mali]|uniref:Phage protein n=1 Tax=Liquorilactobacillus mali TaxID=1618 RepID=A0A0R2FT36_9LACO|nr:phage head-tail connector protein [Liquorilactobacillus mali]KRN31631.1 hypothetical protein IV36_GL001755 [Liquorilactobacillus mali]MDN7145152.1 phage head-tail connector protein [Liquorilactobacillus mali]